MEKIKHEIESRVFGVCSYLGNKLNMPSVQIRKYFIYTSLLTVGSPVIVYLVLAFWVKMRDYVKGSRSPIWDH